MPWALNVWEAAPMDASAITHMHGSEQARYFGLPKKTPLLRREQRAHFDSAEFFLRKEGKQPADTLPLAGECCPEPILPMKLSRSEPASTVKPTRLSSCT